MILLVAVILALMIGLARGGSLRQVADLPLHWGWVALLAFALQVFLVYSPLETQGRLLSPWAGILVLSYLLLFAVVWSNRSLSGVAIIGLGLALNLAVIVANGGFMPVTPEALKRAGQADLAPSLESGTLVSSTKDIILTREETKLWILSDVFVLPTPLPVASTFSPGDVLIAVGAFMLLQAAMGVNLLWK
ncbi:MAG: DUF5317 domain-containing protein [Anaerolineae bacterium]